MAIVVPTEGQQFLLDVLLRAEPLAIDDWLLHLFSNDMVPTTDSQLADFVPATFAGYDIVQLDRDEWAYPTIDSPVSYSLYGDEPVTWVTTSGTGTVYGYYVTDLDETRVLWAERYPTVVTVTTTFPALVQPYLRLRSEVDS